jgi:AcrR family transcriptional regulator
MAKTETADTRARILDAALSLLAEQGVARVTMRAVARKAGVATGLANYHFRSKQALIAAVIAASRSRFLGELDARVPAADGPRTLRRVLETVRALIDLDPDWFRLGADIDALALRNRRFARAAADSKRDGAANVRFYLDAIRGAFGPETVGLAALDGVLLAALDGLAVRKLIDAEFDQVAAFREIERLLLAVLAPGVAPPDAPWDLDPLRLATRKRRRR